MGISFIIPAYNVEKYIKNTIESIINLGLINYEIIVVDDCSTDDTYNVVKNIDNEKIKLLNSPMSKGYAGQPRNIGLNSANYDYVCFIDPDDIYHEKGIKIAFEKYSKFDVIINSYYRAKYTNEGYEITNKYILKNAKMKPLSDYTEKINGICLQRMIFKKSFLINNNIIFNEELPMQDAIFLLDVLKANPKIKTTNIVTSIYFSNRNNSITNQISVEKLIYKNNAIIEIVKRLESMPYKSKIKKKLINNFILWHKNNVRSIENGKYLSLLDEEIFKIR